MLNKNISSTLEIVDTTDLIEVLNDLNVDQISLIDNTGKKWILSLPEYLEILGKKRKHADRDPEDAGGNGGKLPVTWTDMMFQLLLVVLMASANIVSSLRVNEKDLPEQTIEIGYKKGSWYFKDRVCSLEELTTALQEEYKNNDPDKKKLTIRIVVGDNDPIHIQKALIALCRKIGIKNLSIY